MKDYYTSFEIEGIVNKGTHLYSHQHHTHTNTRTLYTYSLLVLTISLYLHKTTLEYLSKLAFTHTLTHKAPRPLGYLRLRICTCTSATATSAQKWSASSSHDYRFVQRNSLSLALALTLSVVRRDSVPAHFAHALSGGHSLCVIRARRRTSIPIRIIYASTQAEALRSILYLQLLSSCGLLLIHLFHRAQFSSNNRARSYRAQRVAAFSHTCDHEVISI